MDIENIKEAITEDMLKAYETLYSMADVRQGAGDVEGAVRLRTKAQTVDAIFIRHVAHIHSAKNEEDLMNVAALILAEREVMGADRSGTALAVDYIVRVLGLNT